MDDGEVDFSNQDVFSDPNMDFLDDFLNLKDSHGCTHTHTCNPPGPDYSHTHTCYHVHTKIVPAAQTAEEETDGTAESSENNNNKTSESDEKKKRPLGNREAVRKYREKKKARAASLEDEVLRLRTINQQLVKRLQGQAVLEAEVARLKCLLVDIRGRIEGEIGSFPYQKPAHAHNPPSHPGSAYMMNPCSNLQCNDQLYCLQSNSDGRCDDLEMNGQGFDGCDFQSLQCLANQNQGAKELPGCGLSNGASRVNSSGSSKRKGGSRAAAER